MVIFDGNLNGLKPIGPAKGVKNKTVIVDKSSREKVSVWPDRTGSGRAPFPFKNLQDSTLIK